MTSSPPPPSTLRVDKFEEAQFLRDLVNLKETQEAIQALSSWCLRNRKNAYRIARCWLKVISKVKIGQKLVLFYLMNDIVQHSKRKQATELLSKCQGVLKEAMVSLRDEKITEKVHRVLHIWEERQIFEEGFLHDLAGLLDPTEEKEDQEVVDNFQPQQLCTQLKIIKALEDDTDYKLKTLKQSGLDLIDVEALRHSLKDRKHGNDYIHDFEEGTKRMEHYIKALEKELNKRRQVIDLLSQGKKYYESLLGEATIVATAYTNFGKRVKNLRKKLVEEKIPELKANQDIVSISPIPSPPPPDYEVPSPKADDEMELSLPEENVASQPITQSNQNNSGDLNSRLNFMMNHATGVGPSTSLNTIQGGNYLANITSCDASSIPIPEQPPTDAWSGYDRNPTPTQEEQIWPQQWPPAQEEEPVPEWQIQPEDEEPLAENDQVYQDNIALARLNRRPGDESVEHAQRVARGSEDMEMSSDDEGHHHHHHIETQNGNNPAMGDMASIQGRLLNIAGQPPAAPSSTTQNSWQQPPPNMHQNFNRPPPPPPQQMPRGGGPQFGGRGGQRGFRGQKMLPNRGMRGDRGGGMRGDRGGGIRGDRGGGIGGDRGGGMRGDRGGGFRGFRGGHPPPRRGGRW